MRVSPYEGYRIKGLPLFAMERPCDSVLPSGGWRKKPRRGAVLCMMCVCVLYLVLCAMFCVCVCVRKNTPRRKKCVLLILRTKGVKNKMCQTFPWVPGTEYGRLECLCPSCVVYRCSWSGSESLA